MLGIASPIRATGADRNRHHMALQIAEQDAPSLKTAPPVTGGDTTPVARSPIRERVVWAVLRLIQAGVAVMPLRWALWIGRRMGDLAHAAVYPRTRVALRQIEWALGNTLAPSEQRAVIRDMYRQFGQGVVEFLRLPRMVAAGRLDELIMVEGEAFLREAHAQGRGVLILTAHYGNFELLATFFAARGYRVNLVTRRLRNGVLDRFWAEQRRRLNIRAIFKEDSLKEVIGRLRRNEAIGYVLDQNMGIDQGVFVEFFGWPACTLSAVAVLAKRFGSPVVPVFITRDPVDPTRHRVVFERPLAFESRGAQGARGDDADIVEQTQRYTAVIERRVRERPDHWIWIHRRWKTRPPGEAQGGDGVNKLGREGAS
jgi:KDO2-lipid IV(A) lauroyltransferase